MFLTWIFIKPFVFLTEVEALEWVQSECKFNLLFVAWVVMFDSVLRFVCVCMSLRCSQESCVKNELWVYIAARPEPELYKYGKMDKEVF